MNPIVKQKWIAALRSGEYKQGKEALRRGEKFCCLGVLCVLAIKSGVEVNVSSTRIDGADKYQFDGEGWFLPKVVQEWAELDSDNPSDGLGNTLSNLNDNNVPFTQIADLIEEHL